MTPSTHELLQYSELQVAAEAFDPSSISGLMQGNGHSSRFTDIEAVAFLQKYSVVAVSPAIFWEIGLQRYSIPKQADWCPCPLFPVYRISR